MSSPTNAPAPRVGTNAPTLRKQSHSAKPAANSNKQQREKRQQLKLALSSPYHLSLTQASQVDSLLALDAVADFAKVANIQNQFSLRLKQNRKRRREDAKKNVNSSNNIDIGKTVLSEGGVGQYEGTVSGHGLTFGFNAITSALQSPPSPAPQSQSRPQCPYAMLVLCGSAQPPSLFHHFIFLSHYYQLPVLTLHATVSSKQLAQCFDDSLPSLLCMAIHRDQHQSLVDRLRPLAPIQSVPWLPLSDVEYRSLCVKPAHANPERAKRVKAKEAANRPLSPRSAVAAYIAKKKQAEEATSSPAALKPMTATGASATDNTSGATSTSASIGDAGSVAEGSAAVLMTNT